LLNNKIYGGTISRKDFGKLKAFMDAIHFLQKGGLDLISGTDELTEAARSILIPKKKEFLTTTQVARYLGIDASTVRRHIKQGYLPYGVSQEGGKNVCSTFIVVVRGDTAGISSNTTD
jgi:excisionase family DNA binding protein